jgi:hypothetical protein
LDAVSHEGDVPEDIPLPAPHDLPAESQESRPSSPITGTIGRDLGCPVIRIEPPGKLVTKTTPMTTVPEVAVAEDGDAGVGKDEVWPSGQSFDIRAVSKAAPVELRLKEDLGAGSGSAIPSHRR